MYPFGLFDWFSLPGHSTLYNDHIKISIEKLTFVLTFAVPYLPKRFEYFIEHMLGNVRWNTAKKNFVRVIHNFIVVRSLRQNAAPG